MTSVSETEQISQEVMALLGSERQVEPFSARFPDFTLAKAYAVVARVAALRRARGENPVGRKIGFTNRSLWRDLGIAAPVWNYMFDRTVHRASSGRAKIGIAAMPEARIEPELVLHLSSAPVPGMEIDDLMACIDWVAPGFEIVFSVFPRWAFTAADAAAAYGVHGALVLGEPLGVSGARPTFAEEIAGFSVDLAGANGLRREGHASHVLGGPLKALKFLVDEIARHPVCEPLKAGEIVTTGTLTEAMPLRSGQQWRVTFQGISLAPLEIGII